MNTEIRRLQARIANYLQAGGLWNPEMMEHDKVRLLLLDIRDELDRLASPPGQVSDSASVIANPAPSFQADQRAAQFRMANASPPGQEAPAVCKTCRGTGGKHTSMCPEPEAEPFGREP